MAKWTIYWNEYASDTYLYGSEVIFHKNGSVDFRNELMPPGTIIKQWYSKTNFQMQKIEPALPMIDGESRYRISFKIDMDEGDNCLARLVFYDRYENEAGSLTLRDWVTEFQCPLKTYSYRLQLVNGGVTHFRFRSVEIEEISDETDKKDSKTK